MTTPLEDEVKNLTDSVNSLVKTLATSNNASTNQAKETLKLTGQLGISVKMQQALTMASDLQLKVMKLNSDSTVALSNNLSKGPGFTNLNSNLAMLETGLEGNSKELSDFLVRSDLLGENVTQMAQGLQGLRGVLGLSVKGTGFLAKEIMDSAKTYKTSSEKVVAGLNKLGNTLTILSKASNGTELITDIVAATSKAAPGAAEDLLNKLFGGGTESLGRLASLGAGQEATAMLGPGAQLSDAAALFGKVDERFNATVGSGMGAIVGAEVFESIYGIPVSLAQQAGVMEKLLLEQQQQSKLSAAMEDALGGIQSIFTEFQTGLAIIAESLLIGFGSIKELFENEIVRYLIQVAGMAAILQGISITLNVIRMLTAISSVKSFAIYAVIAAIFPLLSKMMKGITSTSEHTKVTADVAKKDQESRTLSLLEQYNKRHSAAINELIRQSSRTDLEPSMSEKAQQLQLERSAQLQDGILRALLEQSDLMSRNNSVFGSNPTGVTK